MSDCRQTTERLTPYADGLLPTAEQADVERHLAACPACRAQAAAERSGRSIVRGAAPRGLASLRVEESLPPGLRSRCEALAREHLSRRQPAAPLWRRLVPVSVPAALLMVFTASAFVSLATHRSDGLLAAQLTTDHARCFMRFAGVSGADARQTEQMLRERYGWDVQVPPSSDADGVRLIGAKRCYYSGGALPHVLYRVHGEELSLYVLSGETRPPADLVAAGHRSRVWSRGGRTYVLVSPVAAGDMTVAVRYLKQGAR